MIFRVFALAAAIAAALVCPANATTSGAKRATVDTIIIHAISGPDTSCPSGKLVFSGAPGDAQRWKSFFDKHPFLGIHYVVDRDGVVGASTPENRVARHTLDDNDTAIGIELVHDGDGIEPFGDKQIAALISLIKEIRGRHAIPVENIKGHSDVDDRTFACGGKAMKSKLDPGANFPWIRVLSALDDKNGLDGKPRLIGQPTQVQTPGTMQSQRTKPEARDAPAVPGTKPTVRTVVTQPVNE